MSAITKPSAEVPSNGAAASAPAALSESESRYELSADVVMLSETRQAEAEAIRTIRTHIMARHLQDGRRALAVCAATPNVGCTFTAVNLAVALSQVGVATLLIDGDLRQPALESFIRPSKPAAGLAQCIAAADGELSEFIHQDVLPNLSVMYSGGSADNAQELLANDRFRVLMERCLRDFEFTIIDTPAASGSADYLRIASVFGYTIVVAKSHVSRNSDVSFLARQLQDDGAQIVGAVLSEI